MSIPEPLSILDVPGESRLYLDADLAATGEALALMHAGSGARISVGLDLDDVRNLHRWAGDVLAEREAAL